LRSSCCPSLPTAHPIMIVAPVRQAPTSAFRATGVVLITSATTPARSQTRAFLFSEACGCPSPCEVNLSFIGYSLSNHATHLRLPRFSSLAMIFLIWLHSVATSTTISRMLLTAAAHRTATRPAALPSPSATGIRQSHQLFLRIRQSGKAATSFPAATVKHSSASARAMMISYGTVLPPHASATTRTRVT